jgi:hypothetical protein
LARVYRWIASWGWLLPDGCWIPGNWCELRMPWIRSWVVILLWHWISSNWRILWLTWVCSQLLMLLLWWVHSGLRLGVLLMVRLRGTERYALRRMWIMTRRICHHRL